MNPRRGNKMNYKMRIQVEIEECDESPSENMLKEGKGIYTQVVSQEIGESINGCEGIMMGLMYEALRETLANHLSETSKEVAERQKEEEEEIIKKAYRVDSEVGRIEFDAYYIERGGVFIGMMPALKGKEWYKTQGYKEIGLVHGTTEKSYKKSSDLLNRIRHQEGATPTRTLRDNSVAEGQSIQKKIHEMSQEILAEHRFSELGIPSEEVEQYSEQSFQKWSEEEQKVEDVIAQAAPEAEWIEKMKKNEVPYENPEKSVSVCIDDVNAKRQKEQRKNDENCDEICDKKTGATGHKYVHNTVVHVAQGENSYVINGYGTVSVLKTLLAFLLHNQLLCFNLIFLVDGQKTIYSSTQRAFAWFSPVQFILDWYHLEKRCKEYLSMALKGREIRNDFLQQLLPFLWHGCLDDAISLLKNIDPALVKNQDYVDRLVEYFKRNRPYIPCYSVRKILNLPNSSQAGEKLNDLLVSHRQKRNGMSWSISGSVAYLSLASCQ